MDRARDQASVLVKAAAPVEASSTLAAVFPSNIRVLSSLGMGLDEKAIEAVKNWKFEPAMKDGHPVRVEIAVEVDFHLY